MTSNFSRVREALRTLNAYRGSGVAVKQVARYVASNFYIHMSKDQVKLGLTKGINNGEFGYAESFGGDKSYYL